MRIGIGPGGNPGGPTETLEDPQGPRCSLFVMPADKIKPPGAQDGCHRCRGCHGCRGSGVENCCSEPTSTRAGGQDDSSYTNSLQLKKSLFFALFLKFHVKMQVFQWFCVSIRHRTNIRKINKMHQKTNRFHMIFVRFHVFWAFHGSDVKSRMTAFAAGMLPPKKRVLDPALLLSSLHGSIDAGG